MTEPSAPDPVVEAYKKNLDRSLIRQNLQRSIPGAARGADGAPALAAFPVYNSALPMNRVIRLTPEHTLRRAAKRFLEAPGDNCPKCESTYVRREPAFIHCRCCGNLARIANASLADQALYELRAGLRLAS